MPLLYKNMHDMLHSLLNEHIQKKEDYSGIWIELMKKIWV